QAFFDRWMDVIPTPLGPPERERGYWWELSMRQIEVSRTLVFDAPRRARRFVESLIIDNLDLGRPDEVQLIFGRQLRKNTKATSSTKLVNRGTEMTVNVFYRDSRIKEYLKDYADRLVMPNQAPCGGRFSFESSLKPPLEPA